MLLNNRIGPEMARSLDTPILTAMESFFRDRWNLRPNTVRTYRNAIRRFARAHGTLGELTADNVNDYLAAIADHKTMARNDCIGLHQIALWAVERGILATDPLASVRLPKGHKRRRQPFADTEVPAILDAVERMSALGLRDKCIVMLSIQTALRPAEVWQLELRDVNLADGFLRVRQETTKTDAGARVVPLEPQTVALLDAYIHDQRTGNGQERLFLNNHGEPLTFWGFMNIHYRLRDRLRAIGIDGYMAYRGRHTGLTNWARRGVPAPILQKLAGHKSIVTTQQYLGELQVSDLARIPRAFTDTYGRQAS